MSKISLNYQMSIEDSINSFLAYKRMEGLQEKSIRCYKEHLCRIFKQIDTSLNISELKRSNLEEMITSLRDQGLSPNTIASYVRALKTFLAWCKKEGLCDITIPNYKSEETIKETYSDEELGLLLVKPNLRKCNFPEYRSWVIINFLLNCGCRASTIRNIQIRDIDWENHMVYFRHNKNRKVQVIPLCSQMQTILKEYVLIRKGKDDEYLFCNENGGQLSEYALRSSIYKYNHRRGVQKTSIHLFRHTFAKKYLVDCNGDALTLQRLLGHSTLEMTKRYCNLYNTDIARNFDAFSPLQTLTAKSDRIKVHK